MGYVSPVLLWGDKMMEALEKNMCSDEDDVFLHL